MGGIVREGGGLDEKRGCVFETERDDEEHERKVGNETE